MYHLRLTKALSYTGVVTATRKNSDVYTDDEAIAKAAVASGYFRLLSESESKLRDLVKSSKQQSEPEQNNGPQGGTNGSGKTLDEMNVSELETFAAYKGVELKGVKGKAAILAKIREELPEEETQGPISYGSPTMTELQEQVTQK